MTQPLTPTQADREAAATMWDTIQRCTWADWQGDWLRDGTGDSGPLVQAFARHAQAARLEGVREVERLREALEPFATALDDWGDDTGQPDRWTAWEHPIAMNVTLGDFRRARASLDPLSIAEKGV